MKVCDINRSLFLSESDHLNVFLRQSVLLFYKPKSPISTWNSIILGCDYHDRAVFEDALSAVACDKWKGHYFSPDSKILAIDADGEILLRNCEVSVKRDDSNFVHVYEPETNFYSIVRSFPLKNDPTRVVYISTENVSKLNSKIFNLVSKKIIDKPKDFSMRNGLKSLPTFQTPEHFEKD